MPKGALNITIDGVDAQDSLISSMDGFFTFIRPRIDAIQEVSVSTATPGAESSGEGAAQIKFVTARGTNEYRGGLYWYHRQPPTVPSAPTFPFGGVVTNAAFGFDPNLKTGIVHSWTVGARRALTKDTALEVRYVGTRGDDLWRRYNLNEINVVENDFLREFQSAQANLIANRAAGRGEQPAFKAADRSASATCSSSE